jgi:circadian clock protein KaiC
MAKAKSKSISKVHSKLPKKAKGARREIVQFERVESGIPGLDQILAGGFLKGGTYLILGAPGTGKTIFANQLCFHQISKGGSAVYVTLLAESHTRMFGNLKPLRFFHPEQVATEIQYISGYSILEKEGLDGLLRLLRDLVYQHGANILFIDGIASADELSGSTVQFKKFVHHLNSVLGIAGCTTFLLSSVEGEQNQPEYTMVDGILRLTFSREGMKTAREMEVRKFRGSPHLYGQHFFEITEAGLSVYPRIEAAFAIERPPRAALNIRKKFGMKVLDEMLKGGLVNASTTALLGPAGTGKTQIGFNFLIEGARKGERGLYLSMYEHPDRVEARLNKLGQPISGYLKKGTLQILRRIVGEHLIDKVLSHFLLEVQEKRIERVFIDGMDGLRSNMLRPERLTEVLIAFFHELRALGVTIVMTEETDVTRSHFEGAISYHSAVMDNIFEFRHVELDGQRTQVLHILKTRESSQDRAIREIVFTKSGVEIGDNLEYTEPYLPVVRRKDEELE